MGTYVGPNVSRFGEGDTSHKVELSVRPGEAREEHNLELHEIGKIVYSPESRLAGGGSRRTLFKRKLRRSKTRRHPIRRRI